MKAYILFNKDTATERGANDLAKRLEGVQVSVEMVDADAPRGIQMAENYDILGRPALILVKEDGTPVQVWQGENELPPPADVAYLAHQ